MEGEVHTTWEEGGGGGGGGGRWRGAIQQGATDGDRTGVSGVEGVERWDGRRDCRRAGKRLGSGALGEAGGGNGTTGGCERRASWMRCAGGRPAYDVAGAGALVVVVVGVSAGAAAASDVVEVPAAAAAAAAASGAVPLGLLAAAASRACCCSCSTSDRRIASMSMSCVWRRETHVSRLRPSLSRAEGKGDDAPPQCRPRRGPCWTAGARPRPTRPAACSAGACARPCPRPRPGCRCLSARSGRATR